MATKAKTIKPVAKSVSMDNLEVDQSLFKIQTAISEIHQHNVSLLSYEELYRVGYTMVMNKHGSRLFSMVSSCLREHCLVQLAKLQRTNDNQVLDCTAEVWRNHVREVNMVVDVVLYLERVWIPQQDNKPTIGQLAHGLFREVIASDPVLMPRIRLLVLDLLSKWRAGEWVDLSPVRSMFAMYTELGSVAEALEHGVMKQTEEFYSSMTLHMLTNSTCYEYCVFAETKLKEERVLANQVCPEMQTRLVRLAMRELVVKHSQVLVEMPHSGFLSMVMDNKVQELGLLFSLLEEGVGSDAFVDCAKLFGEYVSESGTHILNDETMAVGSVIELLMKEKQRYDVLCRESFKSHKLFAKAIKEAFGGFMNHTVKCASYLALYTDELLTGKRVGEEDNLDLQLDRVMDLFRHLADKDVFEEYYKLSFAKRLLGQKSLGDDAERSMILKMKTECGHQFTSKLEGMFKDMSSSMQTSLGFPRVDPRYKLQFTAQVLTSGFWPASVHAAFEAKLPSDMQLIREDFEKYYLGLHSGRKMQWNHALGSCEVKTVSGFVSGEQHEFVVSPVQCILMLLLQSGKQTFAHLVQHSQVPRDEVKRQLISMCVNKFQLFNKLQGSKHEFKDEDEYEFNAQFKSKLRKIRIPLVIMPSGNNSGSVGMDGPVTLEEHCTIPGFVSEARNHQMDACLVRIMKSRKRMDHNQLVSEVLAQLQFKPLIPDLKKRIEALIEREYLERDLTDPRMYQYLA
ncbi:hypothetical protein BASA81_008573 [Batrachochytrium salamandrivorans]|nr:hypothetical protein BASA81_008573 [Batrachochytrium salamandrivorans]